MARNLQAETRCVLVARFHAPYSGNGILDNYKTLIIPGFTIIEEDIIRVQFHCNQSCSFCFVSTHLPAMEDAAVREAILAAERQRLLSGGWAAPFRDQSDEREPGPE